MIDIILKYLLSPFLIHLPIEPLKLSHHLVFCDYSLLHSNSTNALIFPEHILFVVHGRFSLFRTLEHLAPQDATTKWLLVSVDHWGRMFTLTNFAFVINRHPLTPLGDENGQKKPLFGPPHGFMVAEGNKIHKKQSYVSYSPALHIAGRFLLRN